MVDPFKAFARKIATQFTPEDISAVHYLANIPERIQGKLNTGVALINYLTNNRYQGTPRFCEGLYFKKP